MNQKNIIRKQCTCWESNPDLFFSRTVLSLHYKCFEMCYLLDDFYSIICLRVKFHVYSIMFQKHVYNLEFIEYTCKAYFPIKKHHERHGCPSLLLPFSYLEVNSWKISQTFNLEYILELASHGNFKNISCK